MSAEYKIFCAKSYETIGTPKKSYLGTAKANDCHFKIQTQGI